MAVVQKAFGSEFSANAESVIEIPNGLEVRKIAPKGSWYGLRSDVTTIVFKPTDLGFEITPSIRYSFSNGFGFMIVACIVVILLGFISVPFLFLGPLWLIVILVNSNRQKKVVVEAIQESVTNALRAVPELPAKRDSKKVLKKGATADPSHAELDALAKLADLRDRGAITEKQFLSKRAEILGA